MTKDKENFIEQYKLMLDFACKQIQIQGIQEYTREGFVALIDKFSKRLLEAYKEG